MVQKADGAKSRWSNMDWTIRIYREITREIWTGSAKVVATPVDTGSKLSKPTDDDAVFDQRKYQSAVGSLLHLSVVATRPDITYAVNNVAKFSANPSAEHWTAMKRITRYLRGTSKFGIEYAKQSAAQCVGFSDSDWGGDVDDRKNLRLSISNCWRMYVSAGEAKSKEWLLCPQQKQNMLR